MQSFFKQLATVVAMCAAIASTGAQAAAISINSTTPGQISFSACDFELGMVLNGTPLTGGTCTLGSSTGGASIVTGSSLTFSGIWTTFNIQPNAGPFSTYFTSALDPTNYTALLTYEIFDVGSSARIEGSFTTVGGSVPNGGMTAIAGSAFSFGAVALSGNVTTAAVSVPVAVSAPGSLALAGLALVALGAVRRRA